MEWKILQYQYPEESASVPGDYNHNANWLKIQVAHQREGYGPAVFRESFLLTYELKEMIREFKRLLSGDSYRYRAEFVEPVLEVQANRQRDDFMVSFDLAFDGYEMMLAEILTEEQLTALVSQLEEMAEAYPER